MRKNEFISLQYKPGDTRAYHDLINNLIKRGEYVLASLVLYRAMDEILNTFIKQNFPFKNWGIEPYYQIQKSFSDIKSEQFNQKEVFLPEQFGFTDSAILVHCFMPSIITSHDLKRVLDCSQIRNTSWLAHGSIISTKKDVEKMRKTFMRVIENLQTDICK